MTIPAGISTALVHMDAPVSFIGEPGRLYVRIQPSVSLVWEATGTPLANFFDAVSPDNGLPMEIELPHTDQDGFIDGLGNSITGWFYTVTIKYEKDGQIVHFPSRDFQILTGQESVDLALVPSGDAFVPQIAPILPVTSIDGQTGAVTLADLDLDQVDNTADSAKPVSTAMATALAGKVAKGELVLNVMDYAAVGDGVADDTAAIQSAINAAAPTRAAVLFPPRKTFKVTTLTAHAGAHLVISAGAEVMTYAATGTALVAAGSLSATASTSTGTVRGESTVTVASAAGFVVGDVILAYSDTDLVPTTDTKRGYLRSVKSIAGNILSVDGPWPFTLASGPVTKVNMAPPVVIEGGGRIRGSDPLGTQTKALIDLSFVREPVLTGVTVGPGGGPGQQLTSCLGGQTEAHFMDLSDFDVHFGYAVNWAGATRGHVVSGGSATRVRHGVTTTGASTVLGEPESNAALPAYVVSEGINAGLDTHEQGIGNMLMGTVINCRIGKQDRATNTILGGMVSGASNFGYYITTTSVGAILLNPVVLNMGTEVGAAAFRLAASAILESPFYPVATANAVNATADYEVRGGGYLAGNTTGTGVRKIGLLGRAAVTQSGTADIKQALVDLGLLVAGNASIIDGLVTVIGTGTLQGRLLRAVLTAAADIGLRVDAITGATGDTAQFRLNGTTKARIGPNGEIEVIDATAGIILKSANGTRYRIGVADDGALTTTSL
jgi:hypothetical protein